MSVTVLAPTPALPPVGRKASMWGKMFGNYKLGSEVVPMEDSGMLSPGMPVEKTRMASVSTGTEQKSTIYNRKASTMSTMAKDSRTVSESSSSKNRAFSISSRRSSKNSIRSWFRSANPDTDANIPAMPTMDRKFSQFSMFSSHNPDSESSSPAASPTASRRPSYVPRNAASSFLRTTTPLSTDEKAEVTRRASVAEQLPVPNLALKARSVSVASPLRANKPAPLLFTSAPADHGLHSMEGACDIDDSDLVSPRGTTFSATSAPRSPADTIMEEPFEHQVDSAKASPELNPTKSESTVNVVELTC